MKLILEAAAKKGYSSTRNPSTPEESVTYRRGERLQLKTTQARRNGIPAASIGRAGLRKTYATKAEP
ncbi:hypothetical protein [Haloplanus halophilus]|uniref:hypothetical protein n=1 Tax=Haloplanus halophilus TaxID=2949993 RepID=UPI00203FF5DF|nr:hypothetical protein [Haloplanus sp. GDY1]